MKVYSQAINSYVDTQRSQRSDAGLQEAAMDEAIVPDFVPSASFSTSATLVPTEEDVPAPTFGVNFRLSVSNEAFETPIKVEEGAPRLQPYVVAEKDWGKRLPSFVCCGHEVVREVDAFVLDDPRCFGPKLNFNGRSTSYQRLQKELIRKHGSTCWVRCCHD